MVLPKKNLKEYGTKNNFRTQINHAIRFDLLVSLYGIYTHESNPLIYYYWAGFNRALGPWLKPPSFRRRFSPPCFKPTVLKTVVV